ncbi:MAG: lysylphosphatidylglycerol synthase transmembrane domain-containing protein [Chloroflexota bacterium]
MQIRLPKQTLRFIIIITASAIFLYFAFRSLVWREVWLAFQQFDRIWFLVALCLILFSDSLHVLRWQLLLKPTQYIAPTALFEAIILGRFADLILPLNIGPVIRAYRLKQRFDLSMVTIFGSLATEGIVGSLVFWAFSILVILLVPLPHEFDPMREQIRLGLVLLTLILIALFITIISIRTLSKRSEIANAIFSRPVSSQWQTSLNDHWQRFQQGLALGRTNQEIGFILLYSLGIRLTFGLTALSVARGFGVDLPYLTYLFIDILVSVAHIVGGQVLGLVGTLEAALTYSLNIYGVPKEIGLSIALIINTAFILPSAILGLIFFLRSGLTWRELTALQKQDVSRNTP